VDISQRYKPLAEARAHVSDDVYIRAAWPRFTAKQLAAALVQLGERCAVITAKTYLARGLPHYRRQKVLTLALAEIARQRQEQERIWTALQRQLNESMGRSNEETAAAPRSSPVADRAPVPPRRVRRQ
jgi:hypothetical protein